jgi:hypothetical protein
MMASAEFAAKNLAVGTDDAMTRDIEPAVVAPLV